MSYFHPFVQAFSNSKLNKRFWKVFSINLLEGIFSLLIIIAFTGYLLSKLTKTMKIPDIAINFLSGGNINALLQNLAQNNLSLLIMIPSLSMIVYQLSNSMFKSRIWKVSASSENDSNTNQWSWLFMIKFLLLKALFFSIFVVLSLIIILITNINPVTSSITISIAGLLLISYFYSSLVFLSKDDGFWLSFYKGLREGSKFHKLIPLYILMIIMLLIASSFTYPLFNKLTIPTTQTFINLANNFSIDSLTAIINPWIGFSLLAIFLWLFIKSYIRIFYVEFIKADSE